MTGTARLYCGLATLSLMAGCSQPTSYSATQPNVVRQPPVATQPLLAAQPPVATQTYIAPQSAPVNAVQPFDGGAYVFEETVAPAPFVEQTALQVEPVSAAPVYLDAVAPVPVEVQAAPAELYVEPTFVSAPPVQSFIEQPIPVAIQQPAPVVEVSTVAPAFVEQSAPVNEVRSTAPVYGEEVPSVAASVADEAPLDLPFRFASPPLPEGGDLAVLDAPVLPPTEILESELAPLVKEIPLPTRSGFTPPPQPGVAGYGQSL